MTSIWNPDIIPDPETVLRQDLANIALATKGSGLVAFSHSNAYAAGTVGGKFRDYVSVKDAPYNADATGVSDATASIQAAINACVIPGKSLYIPAGIYKVTSLTVTGSIQIFGDGFTSIIRSTTNNLNVIVISGVANDPGCLIDSLYFQASVVRIDGSFIQSLNSQGTKIKNCRFDNGYYGISSSGIATQGLRIESCQVLFSLNIGIVIANSSAGPQGVVDALIRDILITGSAGTYTPVGIQISCCGDLQLDHISTIYCTSGLALVPSVTDVIQALYITNSFFDTGTNGINMLPSGGNIELVKLSNVWLASQASNGAILQGTGLIRRVEFLNCTLLYNTANGLYIASTIVTNVQYIGGTLAGNGDAGFRTVANVNNFSIIGTTIGTSGQIGPNNYGIFIPAGTSNNYNLKGICFTTNTTAHLVDGGTGTNKDTSGNVGAGGSVIARAIVTAEYGIDFTRQGATAINAAASIDLPTGSGQIIIHNHSTGLLGLFIIYAGNVVKIAGDVSIVAGAPAANQIGLLWTGAVYRITNGYAAAQSVYVASFKTRDTN